MRPGLIAFLRSVWRVPQGSVLSRRPVIYFVLHRFVIFALVIGQTYVATQSFILPGFVPLLIADLHDCIEHNYILFKIGLFSRNLRICQSIGVQWFYFEPYISTHLQISGQNTKSHPFSERFKYVYTASPPLKKKIKTYLLYFHRTLDYSKTIEFHCTCMPLDNSEKYLCIAWS